MERPSRYIGEPLNNVIQHRQVTRNLHLRLGYKLTSSFIPRAILIFGKLLNYTVYPVVVAVCPRYFRPEYAILYFLPEHRVGSIFLLNRVHRLLVCSI
nr:MAG TPA: hypothetical protein [Caudoviricetes sp.]